MNASYDDFTKLEFRVATVTEAERVEGSEKLLKLQLDVGELGPRQIVAGVGKAYAPETLVGSQIIIVANLEPRTLMGNESNGMLLAARDGNDVPVLLRLEREVPAGSKIN
ncbi:MAG TPA: methionine--tRNA ligase subunit beta [Candidatus Paceibacterota bacterium]|nr:methionine--tRNA ligase subunit beta [Candidatus Paceibacterota bacterium]